jgi:hypothetical protein
MAWPQHRQARRAFHPVRRPDDLRWEMEANFRGWRTQLSDFDEMLLGSVTGHLLFEAVAMH